MASPRCSVCRDAPARARGMCSACYQYQRRTGAERDVVALNAAHARSLDAAWARLERDLALSRG